MSIKEYKIDFVSFDVVGIRKLESHYFAEECWPVVYLLKEKSAKNARAYVGETTDLMTRLARHLNHPDKNRLHEVRIISCKKFNKSATLDIEAYLIKYLSGDGYFRLLNANLGLVNHSYYQRKEIYHAVFEAVWDDFIKAGLARYALQDIDNSPLFKYSPYKSLSIDQTESLIMILESLLDNKYRSFVIEGGAGSGKTVLAVFLFKLLNTPEEDFNFSTFGHEERRIMELVLEIKRKQPKLRMALVIPMESFRATVKKIFKHVKGLSGDMVIGPAELATTKYDILLVDEAHRLRRRANLGPYFGIFDQVCETLGMDKETNHELDWVLKQSRKRILFYDEFQSIKPSDVPQEEFDMLKNKESVKTEYLLSQFRVKGGKKYVKFINRLLQCELAENTEKIKLKGYDFLLFHDLQDMIDRIKEKEQKEHLSRIVAGYAWPWPSQKNKGVFDIEIGPLRLRWNSTRKNWVYSDNAINEVGCIHTVQGYDLNYAGVIFGNEIGYDKEKGEIIIRKENYFDQNGKNGIKSPEQLKKFIINIYKTLLLRGINGTFIYVCDEGLREYFSKHIPAFVPPVESQDDVEQKLVPYVNSVPFFELEAAAGKFSGEQLINEEPSKWFRIGNNVKISRDHFACRVIGESMNKIIPNGTICLFRKYDGGTRNGKVVLASHRTIQDADSGSNYTVKKYFSEKVYNADGTWEHERIFLKPFSTDPFYQDIILEPDELSRLRILGVFECIL